MKYIELVSLDYELIRKLGQKLERKLSDLSFSVKTISADDCLLAQAIKVMKSYPSIEIDKNTLVFLETAREYQSYLENVKPIEKTDILVINTGSYLANMMLLQYREEVKKVTLKHLMRKIAKKPDMVFYIRPEIEKFRKRRKSKTQMNRVEDSMKGMGLKSRDSKYIEIINKISSQHGSYGGIIEVEDNIKNLDPLVDSVIESLKTNGII